MKERFSPAQFGFSRVRGKAKKKYSKVLDEMEAVRGERAPEKVLFAPLVKLLTK